MIALSSVHHVLRVSGVARSDAIDRTVRVKWGVVMRVFCKFATILAFALFASPLAARAVAPKLVIDNVEGGNFTTVVTAIDYANRLVMLRGPRGNWVTLRAGPGVVNFDQVRPGDTVTATFTLNEQIAVFPAGVRAPAPRVSYVVGAAPVGALPGGAVRETTVFAATVVAIDYAQLTVVLRGPGGRTHQITVAPDAVDFTRIRQGDKVIYRDTMTLTVMAAGPGGPAAPYPGAVIAAPPGPPVGVVVAERVRTGLLACSVSPSVGLIVGSRQGLACLFTPDGLPPERYTGAINRVGLDVGFTAGGQLAWAVYAPTAGFYPGALAGLYVGASGEAAFGLGLGANVLVGGSNRTIALQPVSVEGTVGVNLALGVAGLELFPAP